MARACWAPWSVIQCSSRLDIMVSIRSPGSSPSATSPSENSAARSRSSAHVSVLVSPLASGALVIAARSPNSTALRSSKEGTVCPAMRAKKSSAAAAAALSTDPVTTNLQRRHPFGKH